MPCSATVCPGSQHCSLLDRQDSCSLPFLRLRPQLSLVVTNTCAPLTLYPGASHGCRALDPALGAESQRQWHWHWQWRKRDGDTERRGTRRQSTWSKALWHRRCSIRGRKASQEWLVGIVVTGAGARAS